MLKLTIAIPACNEQYNIENMLRSVTAQKMSGFILEKILVISDGSTDKTVENAKKVDHPAIQIADNKERKGKPFRINELFQNDTADVVILLDADIKLSSDMVIQSLMDEMIQSPTLMLASGYALPLQPKTFTQQVIYYGMQMWNDARNTIKNTDLYMCEGEIRAFRKPLYKEMQMPIRYAEDVYPYLYCASKGYLFKSVKSALVYYKLPVTFGDYVKQMKRFLKSSDDQQASFDKEFVQKYYTITLPVKLRYLFKYFLKNPFLAASYISFLCIPKILVLFHQENSHAIWDIVESTKNSIF